MRLEINGQSYEVLDPADATTHRVLGPDRQVIGVPCADSSEPLTAEALAAFLANPPVALATPADIAAARWRVENGGVAVAVSTGTHRFDTTRENRSMWLALQLQAQANPTLSQGWKTLDHGFVVLAAADILAVCAAVYAHVEACFAREAQLIANPPALADLTAAFSDLA